MYDAAGASSNIEQRGQRSGVRMLLHVGEAIISGERPELLGTIVSGCGGLLRGSTCRSSLRAEPGERAPRG
jgi:hypothetical protein